MKYEICKTQTENVQNDLRIIVIIITHLIKWNECSLQIISNV